MLIGQLAERVGISTKTVRYYESIGLLSRPARTAGGYRNYGPTVEERLQFIRQAQSSGLSLTEIGSILEIKENGGQSCEHARALLRRHLDDLDEQITMLQEERAELAELARRSSGLDPATCTDKDRCQVIAGADRPDAPPRPNRR